MKQFNVLCWDFNSDSLVPYDVLPYFRERYKEQVKQAKKYPKNDYWKVPTTREELKEFIEKKSMYQFFQSHKVQHYKKLQLQTKKKFCASKNFLFTIITRIFIKCKSRSNISKRKYKKINMN